MLAAAQDVAVSSREAEQQQATKTFRIRDWQIMVRLPEARVGRMMGCEREEAWYSTTRRNNRFLTSIVVAARWAAAFYLFLAFCGAASAHNTRWGALGLLLLRFLQTIPQLLKTHGFRRSNMKISHAFVTPFS